MTCHVGIELKDMNVFGKKWILTSEAYFVSETAKVPASVNVYAGVKRIKKNYILRHSFFFLFAQIKFLVNFSKL